jgi:DNA-binding transcriptional regulator YdaS (Cro superfamily)
MTHQNQTSETPAKRIIAAFGGTRKMADIINVPPSTVQSWKDAGVIPARRHQAVLDAARENEVAITPADFFETAQ